MDTTTRLAQAEARYAAACREADRCDSKDDGRRMMLAAQAVHLRAVERIKTAPQYTPTPETGNSDERRRIRRENARRLAEGRS